ncbi:FAD-binding domain-containing protein [Fomitiporia mediterranea MF3/22]|uniref:FAD-binding domain-containing protein n=1 Tax=Fomitiporia mediterranea (strain MF3/22) TaxID=694068 RepID=UPI000440732A|nr:FAD-binding domain-containing protein [Fomitiporia mediterranea MF3/22]EJD05533.1 FAD-binding domain-containing protein [Fomitiporia mediterranea MF3/22]
MRAHCTLSLGILQFCVASFSLLTLGVLASADTAQQVWPRDNPAGANKACQLLQDSFPHLVFFPGSDQYLNDTEHWAVSSQQNSTCSIEPETTDDISAIIKIIGRSDIRARFAVKSGGHAYNIGQSSTPGVQISLSRFTNISYDSVRGTVSIGMGLTWDQVYEYLEPYGVVVAGGRINGVGVGGLSLGGGYSWKTNQYGLTIDTIAEHELVLPTGEQVNVTNATDPDIFFGLKGGLNNFGIVTRITYEALPQSLVYGGLITYATDNTTLDLLNSASSNFSLNNADPKAQMIVNYGSVNGTFVAQILLFYDGPAPAPGVYDEILAIPSVSSNVNTSTFTEFMGSSAGDLSFGSFGVAQHAIPITKYTRPVLDEMITQVNAFGQRLSAENNESTIIVIVQPEPLYKPFSHSRGGAYPHPPSRELTPACPFIVYSADADVLLDVQQARHAYFVEELKNFTHIIQAKAVEEGVSRWDDILYPNYALTDTPLELVYGENVPRLRALAEKYDPDRVMTLTGGFRFLD